MRCLLDTQALIWSAHTPEKLRPKTRSLLEDPNTTLFFSVISLWEIEVKRALNRADFSFDSKALRQGALSLGYNELQLAADHVFALKNLPDVHGDPFDRLLVCQAQVEGLMLVTSDKLLKHYPVSLLRA